MMRRGAMRHFTTVAGCMSGTVGAGYLDRSRSGPYMRLRLSLLLAGRGSASRLPLEAEAAMWGGSLWALEKCMCPRTAPAANM